MWAKTLLLAAAASLAACVTHERPDEPGQRSQGPRVAVRGAVHRDDLDGARSLRQRVPHLGEETRLADARGAGLLRRFAPQPRDP